MHVESLIDPLSATIVVGGTLVATFLRCGLADCRTAIGALFALRKPRFNAERARGELATHVQAIRRDGLVRAQSHHFGDPEFDEACDAMAQSHSLTALRDAHRSHRTKRQERARHAVDTFAQAAELAPVFGLAGTLISLSQLPSGGAASGDFTGAIGMAVLTTLYGLLLGNIVFAPLARVVERAAQAEERERQGVVDWLEAQIAPAVPKLHETAPVPSAKQVRA
ncbi:MotA/TolQ/ExbB proton channel family protein [Novosphingobium sp. 9U]|uniref:MotA/TolQ/ExbB proton channel family protein n=1 Tax=Novosphingobium sp. 9U TaxID=2653158 RepID=UPI0012EF0925|nr:MotA/TolQ/ExbB proton channel family protein [Novosphingobium sp. 9U]VWX53033.1 Flagellar motor rotation protein MotA [Novosphingobium sp. 9U]